MPSRAQKKTLAIIDDDTELLDELSRAFGSAYNVCVSLGDPGTMRMLHDNPPTAIILDLDLVTFDPFELLRLISGDPSLRGAPVLVLASDSDFATFEHAHRAGASEYVTKPFSPDELRPKLDALVSGRKRRTNGRLKLGAVLVASGLVTQEQLDGALERQHDGGGRLGEVLVPEGLVTGQDIVTAVAGQMRIGVVDLSQTTPQPAALGLLPRDFIVRRRLMPLSLDDNGSLVVAMTNPLDVISIDEVGMRTKKRVVPVICTDNGFDEAVAIYFSSRGKLKDAREDRRRGRPPADVDADIIEIVDSLLTDAAQMGASDIHLEPGEESFNVRFRIDGVLHEMREFPKELQAGIISRLKIMGNLNIAERRLPQDGRASFELSSGESVDLRLASIPSMYGENLTIRILEVSPLPPTLAVARARRRQPGPLRGGAQGARGRHRHRRPHGLGQVHHPVHDARAHQDARAQGVHGGGPHRAQDRGHHPDRGQTGHRSHVRPGAARARARRSGRDHGRRDPRPRDRQDGGRLGDHRPPGLQHAAHQRRLVRRQPPR